MVPPGDADRAQAEAFCDELNRQIDALDGATDKLKAAMARYLAERRDAQVKRVQTRLRSMAVERRKLVDMLHDLGHSHPCQHGVE